ncbi:Serine/threonine-protein kinase PAK 6 [Tulasnella sp. 419]|nr:Serine/threonine-protein kinase PAK 6 [Tulasnella sp. 419]
MVTRDGTVKIVDFGLAILSSTSPDERTSKTGTPGFMAPEVERDHPATAASDIWSLGMIAKMLVEGRCPQTFSNQRQWLKSTRRPVEEPVLNKDGVALMVCGFLHQCLTVDPRQRASAEELMNEEFFEHEYDPLDLMDAFKPLPKKPLKARCLSKIKKLFKRK